MEYSTIEVRVDDRYLRSIDKSVKDELMAKAFLAEVSGIRRLIEDGLVRLSEVVVSVEWENDDQG